MITPSLHAICMSKPALPAECFLSCVLASWTLLQLNEKDRQNQIHSFMFISDDMMINLGSSEHTVEVHKVLRFLVISTIADLPFDQELAL